MPDPSPIDGKTPMATAPLSGRKLMSPSISAHHKPISSLWRTWLRFRDFI
jgi:hypothetical protein